MSDHILNGQTHATAEAYFFDTIAAMTMPVDMPTQKECCTQTLPTIGMKLFHLSHPQRV